MPGVARISKDVAKELLKVTPQTTVFVNDAPFLAATEGSQTSKGDTIIASNVTVYVENKRIAVLGARMASGATITTGSPDVEADKIGP